MFDTASNITNDSMSERDKIKAIHDWIVNHTKYDKEIFLIIQFLNTLTASQEPC